MCMCMYAHVSKVPLPPAAYRRISPAPSPHLDYVRPAQPLFPRSIPASTTPNSLPASLMQAYPVYAKIVWVWALLCCGIGAGMVFCWKLFGL